jgi:7,8-dihydropterin-6-yl-methyl-4-(beta-D-ribofuranosyl)aminobenzene 5'-phosphate synthase
MPLSEVDRVRVTTVVDNYIDLFRQDEKVARRHGPFVARKMPDLYAEHGLAHYVEVVRGTATSRIAFDFGPSAGSMNHNFRELGLDARTIDAIALSHGHWDHFGGLLGFLHTYRRVMKKDLMFYGGENHFRPRWLQRGEDRCSSYKKTRDGRDLEDSAGVRAVNQADAKAAARFRLHTS